jgi:hypothetical protein
MRAYYMPAFALDLYMYYIHYQHHNHLSMQYFLSISNSYRCLFLVYYYVYFLIYAL